MKATDRLDVRPATGHEWYDTGTLLIHLPLVESLEREGPSCRITFVSGVTKLVDVEHYDRIRGYIGH